ncbi:hypothetical protein NFJ02_37g94680 [Pycnococcus provasolii]
MALHHQAATAAANPANPTTTTTTDTSRMMMAAPPPPPLVSTSPSKPKQSSQKAPSRWYNWGHQIHQAPPPPPPPVPAARSKKRKTCDESLDLKSSIGAAASSAVAEEAAGGNSNNDNIVVGEREDCGEELNDAATALITLLGKTQHSVLPFDDSASVHVPKKRRTGHPHKKVGTTTTTTGATTISNSTVSLEPNPLGQTRPGSRGQPAVPNGRGGLAVRNRWGIVHHRCGCMCRPCAAWRRERNHPENEPTIGNYLHLLQDSRTECSSPRAPPPPPPPAAP